MTTRDQLLERLRTIHADLAQRYPIRRLALFGSWARGEAREDSDVDILIDADPAIGLRFVQLADEIERSLGRRVDVVSTRAIAPERRKYIEHDLIDA